MYQQQDDYPLGVDEVLARPVKFKPATLKVMRKFRRSKPWRGTVEERGGKLKRLVRDLANVYGLKPPEVDTQLLGEGDSDRSFYMPALNLMSLRGRPSVVTTLHEFGHALGKTEWEACRWSLNLFKLTFPRSWARLRFDGHMVRASR